MRLQMSSYRRSTVAAVTSVHKQHESYLLWRRQQIQPTADRLLQSDPLSKCETFGWFGSTLIYYAEKTTWPHPEVSWSLPKITRLLCLNFQNNILENPMMNRDSTSRKWLYLVLFYYKKSRRKRKRFQRSVWKSFFIYIVYI